MAAKRRGSAVGRLEDARRAGPNVIVRGRPIDDPPGPEPQPEPVPANPEEGGSGVGVLLPLRMETLFNETEQGWRLRLRLIPDEASIRRDRLRVTPLERDVLVALWKDVLASGQPDLNAPAHTWLVGQAAEIAWARFAQHVGPERAAELVGSFPPDASGQVHVPEDRLGEHEPDRVGGWPDVVEIYAVYAGSDEPEPLATLHIDRAALTLALPSDIDEERSRWLVNWEAALAAGLGLDKILPGGKGPTDLLALYAVGLSDEHPAEHFAALAGAGDLAVLPLGSPTNTVDGAPAADLAHADRDWLQIARRRLNGDTHRPLSGVFIGQDGRLPAIPDVMPLEPGHSTEFHSYSNELVKALWPALWGHTLEDIWGRGDDAQALWRWAFAWLHPEGPLPPIRIGAQPYGLLPVSALSRWKADAADGQEAPIEAQLAPRLAGLLADWARSAPANVVGASHARLMDLLGRDGVTRHYAYRQFLPADFFAILYAGDADSLAQFQSSVEHFYESAVSAQGQDPARRYLTHQPQFDLQLPLVEPTHWPERYEGGGTGEGPMPFNAFESMLNDILQHGHDWSNLREMFGLLLPDSLLVRLMIYANMRAAANVVRADAGDLESLLEPMVQFNTAQGLVAELARMFDPDSQHDARPVLDQYHAVREALRHIFVWYQRPRKLERSLRAVLDTASYRIDPWVTGVAWRRLTRLQAEPEARPRLGVYGWLDGPFIGTPGPTESGLLHAPSYAQALTSAILRDKHVAEKHEPTNQTRHPWHLNLESRVVRAANDLAEEARLGAHIWEVLGRRVERIAETHENVLALRAKYPLRPGRPDRNVVCNGQAALRGLLDASMPFSPTPAQEIALKALEASLDAYADLLVAEATHLVVSGEAATAGAVMDAAAGLGMPPTLEVLKTRRSGYGLTSSVLAVLPNRGPETLGPDAGPAELADPSVAAFVEQTLGAASEWTWQAEDGSLQSLAGIGLAVMDAVQLAEDVLADIFSAALGAPLDHQHRAGADRHRRARQLVAALGREPALLADLAPQDTDRAVLAPHDQAMIGELTLRLEALQAHANNAAVGLEAAASASELAQALRVALRWGIVPLTDPAEREAGLAALFGGQAEAEAELLTTMAGRAAATLKSRLKAVENQVAAAQSAARGALVVQSLARAIAELASPDGQLAILGRLPASALRSASGVISAAPDTALAGDWLATMAALRQPLAALEALQIEADLRGGFAPLTAWSSAPDDHWQLEVAAHNAAVRGGQAAPDATLLQPRFVAAFGPAHAWSEAVAVGRIDHWTETIPLREHVSTAAFGFNAPAAQAPQAILLAVPPALDAPLDSETLLAIVREARLLARARAANADDLGRFQPLRATLLPASGRSAVRLDPGLVY